VILSKAAAAKLAELPDVDRAAIVACLQELPQKFGQPHLHAGLGLRRLRAGVFEFRASRDLRGLFLWRRSEIRVERFGDHDAIQDYLRNVR
jgi:hypothetical protein